MGATHSVPNADRQGRTPTKSNMDDVALRLVVAFELEEARSLKDDSNGTSDGAMARRIAIDQLLSCRAINEIRETTTAELALAIAPLPSATDTAPVAKTRSD